MALDSDRRKNKVHLSLGSNLGDRKSNLKLAIKKIQENLGEVIKVSSIYETDSWGNKDLPNFLNMAVLLETEREALELMEVLLVIEADMGRHRFNDKRYHSRIIDIDIIYFNRDIISVEGLEIPHPRMHQRNFVLAPIVEISPDFIHPVLGRSNSKLLNTSTDNLNCNRTI